MLSSIFGIDLGGAPTPAPAVPAPKKPAMAKAVTAPKKPAAVVANKPVPATEHTMAELRAMGHSAAKVKAMLAEGSLERVSYGWYRFTR
jgi:hypothetical protein